MYPLGVLFGLGFDTSSEIALLGISSIQAARGTSIWLILLFPMLFTAGMCLLDTIDGALMLALYTSAATGGQAQDPVAVLYYNVALTGVTVVVAGAIGALQVLGLAESVVREPTGAFWDGVRSVEDHYDVVGGGICGFFVLAGVGSVLVYGPWRRWVDRGSGEVGIGRVEEGFGGGEVVELDEGVNHVEAAPLSDKKGGVGAVSIAEVGGSRGQRVSRGVCVEDGRAD